MSHDLSLLSHNFPVLLSVEKPEKDEPPFDLIANPSGTYLHKTSEGWGRFWRVLYAIIWLFAGDSFKLRKVQEALQKTCEVYKEQLPHIAKYVQQYETYLKKACKGFNLKEDQVTEIRSSLTEWNDTTLPFLLLIRRKQHEKINDIFQHHFGKDGDLKTLFNTDILKQCIKIQHIIDLEGTFQGPLPLEALARICTGSQEERKLYEENRRQITAFVKKANSLADTIGVRLFHRTLRDLMTYIEDDEKNLARLEMTLLDWDGKGGGGCKIFNQPDEEHIRWASQLKPGDTLICKSEGDPKGSEIILAEQIGKKPDGVDKNLFFGIQGQPDRAVWIAPNEASLQMKHWIRSEYVIDNDDETKPAEAENNVQKADKDVDAEPPIARLTPVNFYEIEKNGKFAIVERLKKPLDQITWKSTDPNRIARDDQRRCGPICEIIRDMVNTESTPVPLESKYLMFDRQNQLRSTKMLQKSKVFNFNAVENNLVIALSKGNLAVYRHIMRDSGMTNHRYAEFYRRVVKNAVSDEVKEVKDEKTFPFGKGVPNSIRERGQTLCDDVVQLKKQCLEKLHEQNFNAENINKVIGKAIMKAYNNAACGGVLWPTLIDDVVAIVTRPVTGEEADD